VARTRRTFSAQFKEEAVKLVIEGSRPIAAIARELGIGEATLGNWVNAYRREHAGEEPALNINERERLRQLEREARELRMENEFLKKAGLDSGGQRNGAGGRGARGSDRPAGNVRGDEGRLVAAMAGR
jgi:transposase